MTLRIDQRSILLWITISAILFLMSRTNFLFPHDLIFERLQKSIITDYLTGLYNRQGFMQSISREITRARPERNNSVDVQE